MQNRSGVQGNAEDKRPAGEETGVEWGLAGHESVHYTGRCLQKMSS